MKSVFVDTAAWMAMVDGGDPHHEACASARDEWLGAGAMLISTDYVADETLTLIRARLGLAAARQWWKMVQGSSRLRWEWIGPERAEKAREWFFKWKDKRFSFTDCTSFVVMR